MILKLVLNKMFGWYCQIEGKIIPCFDPGSHCKSELSFSSQDMKPVSE